MKIHHAVTFALLMSNVALGQSLIVGGFDQARGGPMSIASGATALPMKNAIIAGFPCATFVGNPQLTSAFLSGIDVLVVSSFTAVTCCSGAVLSAAEQQALANFVSSGGAAVILVDNGLVQPSSSGDSFASVFQFVVTPSYLSNGHAATVAPLVGTTVGPFGSPVSIPTWWPGWFTSVPGNSTTLATLVTNGGVVSSTLPPDAFGPGSGSVLLHADTSSATSTEFLTILQNFVASVGSCSPASKSTFGVGCDGLALDSNAPAVGLSWDLTATGLSAISPIAAYFFGATRQDPGIPLPTLGIAAPGCNAHVSSILGSLDAPNVSGQATLAVTVPLNASLVGASLVVQAIGLTLSTSALLATSNGLEGVVGF